MTLLLMFLTVVQFAQIIPSTLLQGLQRIFFSEEVKDAGLQTTSQKKGFIHIEKKSIR